MKRDVHTPHQPAGAPANPQVDHAQRTRVQLAGVLATLGLAALVTLEAPFVRAAGEQVVQVSAPGRVLGRSETLELAFPTGGRIESIAVQPGARVREGQLLATLDCAERDAALAGDEANLRKAQVEFARLRSGARTEERTLSTQQLQLARAEHTAAEHRLARIRNLRRNSGGTGASEAELEAAQDLVAISAARVATATAAHALVVAGPRNEDVQSHTQQVARQAQSAEMRRAELAHCTLRAPMDGVVLKLLADDGETVSALDPKPVLAMADLSSRRVRVEVDERDVHRVRIGQAVDILSEANPTLRAQGKVVRIDAAMGRRETRTLDPADKSDRDVLEVIVDIGDGLQVLPVDYRVTAVFG